MLHDEIKMMVGHYFDGELNKNKEALLFSELSGNEECREYFKEMNRLKSVVQNSVEEFPIGLESRIYSYIKNRREGTLWYKRFFPVLSYSLAVILLIVSLFMFNELRNYRNDIQLTSQKIIEQQKTINLLINSLPNVEVESEIQNAVIVKANL